MYCEPSDSQYITVHMQHFEADERPSEKSWLLEAESHDDRRKAANQSQEA